ncbi:hypothetical protein RFF05_13690 [Bengtsoniella intestinalis]|uniref:hypothetical protein n=1 Tax=Bengtsoniella intestinalis TaxID=3073143 RepID=UPI00391EE8AA
MDRTGTWEHAFKVPKIVDVDGCGGVGGGMTVVALSATAPTHTHTLGTPKKWHYLSATSQQGEARKVMQSQIRPLGTGQESVAPQR